MCHEPTHEFACALFVCLLVCLLGLFACLLASLLVCLCLLIVCLLVCLFAGHRALCAARAGRRTALKLRGTRGYDCLCVCLLFVLFVFAFERGALVLSISHLFCTSAENSSVLELSLGLALIAVVCLFVCSFVCHGSRLPF